VNPERFHLTLTADGRPIANGWWASEETARRKFRSWVGDWGRPGARVALTDEDEQQVLASWPDET
jgi:hypothetical protein